MLDFFFLKHDGSGINLRKLLTKSPALLELKLKTNNEARKDILEYFSKF